MNCYLETIRSGEIFEFDSSCVEGSKSYKNISAKICPRGETGAIDFLDAKWYLAFVVASPCYF